MRSLCLGGFQQFEVTFYLNAVLAIGYGKRECSVQRLAQGKRQSPLHFPESMPRDGEHIIAGIEIEKLKTAMRVRRLRQSTAAAEVSRLDTRSADRSAGRILDSAAERCGCHRLLCGKLRHHCRKTNGRAQKQMEIASHVHLLVFNGAGTLAQRRRRSLIKIGAV